MALYRPKCAYDYDYDYDYDRRTRDDSKYRASIASRVKNCHIAL